MGLFGKKEREAAVVQTAREITPTFGMLDGGFSLHTQENALYDAIREAVPVVDAAINKIVRLVGSFVPDCGDAQADAVLRELFESVPVAGGGNGIDAFVWAYLDSLLCYGNAVGEIVLDRDRQRIALLYNAPLDNLEIRRSERTLQSEICVRRGAKAVPVLYPELVMHTALSPRCGEVKGVSLLRSLPFVCSVLLQIYKSIVLEAYITEYIASLKIGEPLFVSHLCAGICALDGVHNHKVTSPVQDITAAADELIVLGSVTINRMAQPTA